MIKIGTFQADGTVEVDGISVRPTHRLVVNVLTDGTGEDSSGGAVALELESEVSLPTAGKKVLVLHEDRLYILLGELGR